jgi:hypothetical protein
VEVFVKTLAIFGFGMLLHILIGSTETVDTRHSESSTVEEGLQAERAAGETADQGDLELVGSVMQTGTSFVLISEEEDFIVAPRQAAEKGLSAVVGKRVKVTATLVGPAAGEPDDAGVDVIGFTEIE